MQRKLIQISPSTAVVSLPSSWIRKNKLKKGTALFVEENENRIIISTTSKKSSGEITLNISTVSGKTIWAMIDAAYIAGYDTITVLTKDQIQASYLTKVVRYFPGLMIYEERKHKVQLQAMAESVPEDLNKILSRIFHLQIVLMEDAREAIKIEDWKMLLHIKKRDYNVNSYVSYCQRQINKYGFTPFSKTGVMHSYLKIMEIWTDRLTALLTTIGRDQAKLESQLLLQIEELCRALYSLHFNYSLEKVLEFEQLREKAIKSVPKKKGSPYPDLLEIIELFYDLEELEMQLHF